VKTDSKVIPAPLFEVAASDLPMHTSRTYTNGSSTFEVVNADKHTVRLLTNMYAEDTEPVANHTRKGSYKTAVHLFDNESPQELVRIFQLDETWATKASALIIHHHLGWDVLRSEAQQGTNATLTYADAKGMKVSQLRAIRAQMLPRARQSVGTKEDMLHELFPNEQREVDETRAAEQGQKRKRRSREKLRDLALIRERVRIHF